MAVSDFVVWRVADRTRTDTFHKGHPRVTGSRFPTNTALPTSATPVQQKLKMIWWAVRSDGVERSTHRLFCEFRQPSARVRHRVDARFAVKRTAYAHRAVNSFLLWRRAGAGRPASWPACTCWSHHTLKTTTGAAVPWKSHDRVDEFAPARWLRVWGCS